MPKRTLFLMLPAVLALGVGAAMAQHPGHGEGVGSGAVTLSPSDPNPSTGETVSLTVTITDSQGNAVGGETCAARVAKQPGEGVTVSPASVTSNANGQATLEVTTGDSLGEVGIVVECEGDPVNLEDDLEARATIIVGGEIAPPDTGTGTAAALGEASGAPTALLAGLIASALAVAGAGTLALKRRR